GRVDVPVGGAFVVAGGHVILAVDDGATGEGDGMGGPEGVSHLGGVERVVDGGRGQQVGPGGAAGLGGHVSVGGGGGGEGLGAVAGGEGPDSVAVVVVLAGVDLPGPGPVLAGVDLPAVHIQIVQGGIGPIAAGHRGRGGTGRVVVGVEDGRPSGGQVRGLRPG